MPREQRPHRPQVTRVRWFPRRYAIACDCGWYTTWPRRFSDAKEAAHAHRYLHESLKVQLRSNQPAELTVVVPIGHVPEDLGRAIAQQMARDERQRRVR